MNLSQIKRVIISRTDAIGDVVLTLPMASWIKANWGKGIEVIFFGKTYTQPVISCCDSIDEFLNYDDFIKSDREERKRFLADVEADAIVHVFPRREIAIAAKQARIPFRIGTSHRLYHWLTCNRLVHLGRKNSLLHESQLNLELLVNKESSKLPTTTELAALLHLTNPPALPAEFSKLLSADKFKLVIHPKSHASAREWSLDHYRDLIGLLPSDSFQFILTGGEGEKELLNDWAMKLPLYVINLAGRLSLNELIALLNKCDGILAASTGPLHIAAGLGKHAWGIYPPIRPMNPSRWAPIGRKAEYIVIEKQCSDCRNNPLICHCMNEITPAIVAGRILERLKK